MAELGALLQRLRNGEMPTLGVAEVEVLVGWLLGKGDEMADLPRPEHDPVLQQMVFYRLDATLFSAGELRLAAAGLGPEEPKDLRKTRFRRLAGAFHPDRHPDLADWLTERSQAVLRAYGRFKHDDEPAAPTILPATPYPGYPPPRPARRGPFRNSRSQIRSVAESLRRRFGSDRFLPYKLIGGLAVIAMLPVLNLLLVPEPGRFRDAAAKQESEQSRELVGNETNRSDAAKGEMIREELAQAATAAGASVESESAAGEILDRGSAGGAAGESAGGAASYREVLVEAEANADSALLEAAREAIRLGQSEYAHLPSVDEQLEAMGLDNDTERLYRRIQASARSSSSSQAVQNRSAGRSAPVPSPPQPVAATEPDADAQVGAGAESIGGEVEVKSPGVSTLPTESATVVPVPSPAAPGASSAPPRETGSRPQPEDRARVDVESIRDADGESESRPVSTAATHSARTGAAERDGPTDEASSTEIEPQAEPALEGSELTLGLLASHPAGAVLRGYAGDIESGNLIALLSRFDRQARHGSLRGTDAIARHYQALFERASPRRTVLKVVRVERDGDGWQVETELRVEGLRGSLIFAAQDGRAAFTLAGSPLRIHRLEF